MKKGNAKRKCKSGSRKPRQHQNFTNHCQESIKNNSMDSAALFNLANEQLLKGNLKSAKRNYEYGLELESTNVEALNWLALILILMCDYRDAIQKISKAILIKPGFTNSYLTRGSAYKGLGKYDEAIDDFDFVIFHFPKSVEAHIGRGEVKFLMNDIEGALADYRCAAELNPTLKEVFVRIDQLNNLSQSKKLRFHRLFHYLFRFRGKFHGRLSSAAFILILLFNEQMMDIVDLMEV